MIQHNSSNTNSSGRLAGVIFLALIWIWLVYILFTRGGMNFYNIFIAAATGIIIFVPLWKKYIRPIIDNRKKK